MKAVKGFPLIMSLILLFMTGLSGIAFAQDQPELLWKYSAGGRIYASQAEGPDGSVFLISENRGLHSLSPATGVSKWLFRPGGKFLPFIVTSPDGTVFVASDRNELFAVNPGGSARWVYHMKGKPVVSPAVLPDGSLVVVFPDKKMQIVSRKGILRETRNIESLPIFPLIVFQDSSLAWFGEDKTLRVTDRDGRIGLNVTMDTLDTVMIYSTTEECFYLGSVNGILTRVSRSGDITKISCPVKERIVFLLEHPNGLVLGIADGSIWIKDRKGTFTLFGNGPNPGGYGAMDATGTCYYPSAGGGIVLANRTTVETMPLETAVTAPLLTSSGYLLFGGADWVLYGYKTQPGFGGWSQEGGNTSRNGGSSFIGEPVDPDQLYGDRGDYHYYRYLLDNGTIENLWVILNDLKKQKNIDTLKKNIPFYDILVRELGGAGTVYKRNSVTSPDKDFALIRGEAYTIIAALDDFRYREILLDSLAAEEDTLALALGFKALGQIGVDFDGRSMELIAGKTKECRYLDDRLALSAAESILELRIYNGRITDQSAYMIMDYLLKTPGVSRETRKKIYGIFKMIL